MPLRFQPSPEMTLGVELELQLVDWRTADLCPAAPRVLAALGGETSRIKPEIFRSMIEVNTGICADVTAVRRDIDEALDDLRRACDAIGVEIISAGTHPFARHSDRLTYPSERYVDLIERNAWIARRLLIFGLHVHVGMRDGDHAVAMMNAISARLGHLLALSASSPYWAGEDTGLASTRITIFESVPTAGTPPTFTSWAELEDFYDRMIASRSVRSMKDLWWDIRPSPGYGTLEIRICDCPSTIDETLAIVALVQCLLTEADEEVRSGRTFAPVPQWLMRENKWRAARHGLDAEIILDTAARTRPLRDDLLELVNRLAPIARRLGCAEDLARVAGIVENGGSYARQRNVFDRTRSVIAVAGALIDELRAPRI